MTTTSPDPKSEAFHRLARKRVDTTLEAIRIFSNLSSANYVWTSDEVLSYVGEIEHALGEALSLFSSQKKRWPVETITASSPPPPPPPTPEPVEIPTPRKSPETIWEIIQAANNDREVLAEIIRLQRQVIERYQQSNADLSRTGQEANGVGPDDRSRV